jgi:hypothetical protein
MVSVWGSLWAGCELDVGLHSRQKHAASWKVGVGGLEGVLLCELIPHEDRLGEKELLCVYEIASVGLSFFVSS